MFMGKWPDDAAGKKAMHDEMVRLSDLDVRIFTLLGCKVNTLPKDTYGWVTHECGCKDRVHEMKSDHTHAGPLLASPSTNMNDCDLLIIPVLMQMGYDLTVISRENRWLAAFHATSGPVTFNSTATTYRSMSEAIVQAAIRVQERV